MQTGEKVYVKNENFNILDKVALLEIFKNLHPWEVLDLCRVNIQLGDVCKNESIFVDLLKYHFPNVTVSKNPKQQYITLVEKTPRYYTIKLTRDDGESYIADNETAHFYGFEKPQELPKDVTWFITDRNFDEEGYYWIAATMDPGAGGIYFKLCKTVEEAIDAAVINMSEIMRNFDKDEKHEMIQNLIQNGAYETYYGNGMNIFNQVVQIAKMNH